MAKYDNIESSMSSLVGKNVVAIEGVAALGADVDSTPCHSLDIAKRLAKEWVVSPEFCCEWYRPGNKLFYKKITSAFDSPKQPVLMLADAVTFFFGQEVK